ncbi:MAG: hypothetical protein ACRDIB_18080 [Ardenticatenaceae bacterium]
MNDRERLRNFVAFDGEAASSIALMGHGLRVLMGPSWMVDEAAVVLTCLAAGTERLLKLTVGHMALADGEEWPGDQIRQYGHHIARLRGDVDALLVTHMRRATGSKYIDSLLTDIAQDRYLDGIFYALDRWADKDGRYRNLDILAGKHADTESAQQLWEQVESTALADHPELLTQLGGGDARSAATTLRRHVAFSLLRWWHSYYRAWQHGVCGAQGRQRAAALDPTSCRAIAKQARELLSGR